MTKSEKSRVFWTVRVARDAIENLREIDVGEEIGFDIREMLFYMDNLVNELWDDVEEDK